MRVPYRKLVGYIAIGGLKLDVSTQKILISMTAGQHGHEILAVYIEETAGRSAGWPELVKAIDHARRTDALLVVARPGGVNHLRVRFWAKLAETDVPIVLPIGELTPADEIKAVAQAARSECDWIAYLTREALFQLKQNGVKLGTPRNLTPEARRKGAKRSSLARSLRAMEETAPAAKIGLRMRSGGSTLQAIADELNRQKLKTRRSRRWRRVQVKRMLDRIGKLKRLMDQGRKPAGFPTPCCHDRGSEQPVSVLMPEGRSFGLPPVPVGEPQSPACGSDKVDGPSQPGRVRSPARVASRR
jgi:hypothetical protein